MDERVYVARGGPREAGMMLGRARGAALGDWIDDYLDAWPARDGVLDPDRLAAGAGPWLDTLPDRYREELEGVAEGSGVDLEHIARGHVAEHAATTACSGVIGPLAGRAWVGRNNDVWAPRLWGGVTVHEIEGRRPRLGLGVAADTFTTTGINADRLWLHYNFLETVDEPSGARPALDPFVWVADALETCESLSDVERRLADTERTSAMLLFAVDGSSGAHAIYECGCASHVRRPAGAGCAVGTNHRVADVEHTTSHDRHDRLETIMRDVSDDADPVTTLRAALADEGVEQRQPDRCTVFSAICCPATGELWLSSGDGPSASTGAWRRIRWPFG